MNSFRAKLGRQRRSKRLKIENCFAVKYIGCTTLEKDIKVVEETVKKLTNKVLNKEKGSRVSGKFVLRITEKRISLFPKAKKYQEDSEVFSVAIEKISYGYFPPIRNYHILALNSHASNCEIETYVMCCESREDMLAIKLAFYSAFKGKYFARLRIKRKKNSILSNQLYSFDETHSRLNSTESRSKNAQDEPLAISNEELNDCPKDEMKKDLENQVVVDMHHEEQSRRQEKSAGTNGDSGRTACPTRNTMHTNKDQLLIMYRDSLVTSSRC